MNNSDYQADISWGTNAEQEGNNVQLDLILDQVNYLTSDDIKLELRQQETREALRHSIFNNISTNVIPQIIRDVATTDVPEPKDLSTDHSIKTSAKTNSDIQGTVLSARHEISLKIGLLNNKPVHALSALYNARGGIAEAITHQVLSNLDKIYLGKESEPETITDFNLAGNQLVNYQTVSERPTMQ